MADVFYTGAAQAIPRVKRLDVTGVDATALYVLTVTGSGKAWRYQAVTGDTADTIAAGLLAAMSASQDGEIRELTGAAVAADATQLTVTGPADGAPFDLTDDSTGTGAVTITEDEPGTGPFHAGNVLNYSTGALPTTGDNLIIAAGFGPKYELDELTAVALAGVYRRVPFTGFLSPVGLPDTNANAGYVEYRSRFFEAKAPIIDLETNENDTAQSVRIKSTSSAAVTARVRGTSRINVVGAPAVVELYNTPADSTLRLSGASVGVATVPGQTGIVDVIEASEGTVQIGPGATLETVTIENSRLDLSANFKVLTVSGESNADVKGTAASSTTGAPGVIVNEGTVTWRSTGVPGDEITVGTRGTFDLRFAPASLAAFDINQHEGSAVYNDADRITKPYDVIPVGCRLQEFTHTTGTPSKITVT